MFTIPRGRAVLWLAAYSGDMEVVVALRHRLQVFVFYDDWCSLCRRSMRTLKRLDLFRLLVPVSFRDPAVMQHFGLDPVRVVLRLHARAGDHPPVEGIDAVILIATRLPPIWPALPILWLAARLGFGQRIYDWLALRRGVIPGGTHHPREN